MYFVKLPWQALSKHFKQSTWIFSWSFEYNKRMSVRLFYTWQHNIVAVLLRTLMCRKKNMFLAFIDFKQAFNTVWRKRLWYKDFKRGISGKCLVTFLKSMYNGIKSKDFMMKLNLISIVTLENVKEKNCQLPYFPYTCTPYKTFNAGSHQKVGGWSISSASETGEI